MAIELAEGHDAVPKFGKLARKTFEGQKKRDGFSRPDSNYEIFDV